MVSLSYGENLLTKIIDRDLASTAMHKVRSQESGVYCRDFYLTVVSGIGDDRHILGLSCR
jgi:hypothetical protein